MKKTNRKEPLSKKAGDKLERVGEKIADSGAEKIGRVISRLGDKIEHLKDKKR